MDKRKKRLIKQEKSLLKQAEKHRIKIETEPGKKDTTHDYWRNEIIGFEKRARERKELLERLSKKKGEEAEDDGIE